MIDDMKKLFLATAISALLLLSACAEKQRGGILTFEIAQVVDVEDMVRSQVSDYAEIPSCADFDLSIERENGEPFWSGKASQWKKDNPVNAGSYKVTATFGKKGDEGVEKPYFSGSVNFTVAGGQTTTVTIPVKLGNCIIRTVCTEMFRNYFPEFTLGMHTGAGNDFILSEDEAVFIDAYRFTLSGSLVNQGGTVQSFGPKEYEALRPATCYSLKFDAAGTGGLSIMVSFDDNTEEVDLGDVELN